MALAASTTLSATAQRVTDVFTDEEFIKYVSFTVGGELKSFEISGPTTGAFTTKTVRTLPTDRMPDIARKVVGATLTVTQVETWEAPAADGSRNSTIKLTVGGAPLDVTAVQKLSASGENTVVDLTGEVKSSIPFLGAKIASAAEPVVGRALNLQATLAQEWLTSHPA
ncbi:proteinase inhibitor I25 cystatin [Arthrobacter sp. ERGS1:01]|uniref:DUF2505 domain-containing protein n=1 Tax=Arthrobacter sp. ERGS1:01 TaxID=1704044 RepID=UPI0006B5828B|nr:DUF2505 domain-containing protein [Arthrobacter sp. ERGS1:01]ALE05176.1 proteinase inhibitor I25 cystatin [Arthrobacter sp. ERGS1:01]